jgi:hypothetical protein
MNERDDELGREDRLRSAARSNQGRRDILRSEFWTVKWGLEQNGLREKKGILAGCCYTGGEQTRCERSQGDRRNLIDPRNGRRAALKPLKRRESQR